MTDIYVSPTGSDSNSGLSKDKPLRTLQRARDVAEATPASSYAILLKSGGVFETKTYSQLKARSDGHDTSVAECDVGWAGRVAFHWRMNKPLLLSTYDGDVRATFRGLTSYLDKADYTGTMRKTAKPQVAIAITLPSAQPVTISNLTIENWEMSAVHIYRTSNVKVESCKIKKVGTKFFPADNFRVWVNNKDQAIYAAGVVYPKFSSNIHIKNCTIKDCHNKPPMEAGLHATYWQKSKNFSVVDCILSGHSGSPFKVDEGCDGGLFRNNSLMSCGSEDSSQPGIIRIQGNPQDTIATNIRFEANDFDGLYQGSGVKWSGSYFDLYEDACSNGCWNDDRSNKEPYSCPTKCRGITFQGNDWNV